YLTIGQLGSKAALTQAVIPEQAIHLFVYPTKHRDDKVFERHGDLSVRLRWLVPLRLAYIAMPHRPP
ncbi:MAG: hypothetical protein KDJ28_19155, partial [Candidatus Competibacteraceae bacterium]|nr:hypothetical protein [Candidatus Competibacteraceae bacterium]